MSLKGMNLCIYCGASERVEPKFREIGKTVGSLLAKHGINMVYGGGRMGVMGDVSTTALEEGGQVIGYIPELLVERETAHKGIQELNIVDSMHTRKLKMYERSNGFLILPGGFGTLDEFFEIMTWKQLSLHQKPIVIYNFQEYWSPLINLLHHTIDQNFAKTEHRFIFDVVNTNDELIHVLKTHITSSPLKITA
jgi:hypothetical protein